MKSYDLKKYTVSPYFMVFFIFHETPFSPISICSFHFLKNRESKETAKFSCHDEGGGSEHLVMSVHDSRMTVERPSVARNEKEDGSRGITYFTGPTVGINLV